MEPSREGGVSPARDIPNPNARQKRLQKMNCTTAGYYDRDARNLEKYPAMKHKISPSDEAHGRASVPAPAPYTPPLGLPGVMDAEGRVDESRLRTHIIKNGKS